MTIFLVVAACLTLAGMVAMYLGLSASDRQVLFTPKRHFQGRTYSLALPKSRNAQTKIILGLDGFGGNGKRFSYYTSLHNVDRNAVVIYPDPSRPRKKGERPGWNACFCCGSGWVSEVDDVGFLLGLVEKIRNELQLSNAPLFAAGFSNGAFMVQRLAAEHPAAITAVVSVAGTIGTEKKHLMLNGPVPILLVHGTKDRVVPFEGGAGSDPDFKWLSHESTKEIWERNNGQRAEVRPLVLPGAGHVWFDWRLVNFWHKKPSVSVNAIAFFNEQTNQS